MIPGDTSAVMAMGPDTLTDAGRCTAMGIVTPVNIGMDANRSGSNMNNNSFYHEDEIIQQRIMRIFRHHDINKIGCFRGTGSGKGFACSMSSQYPESYMYGSGNGAGSGYVTASGLGHCLKWREGKV